MNLGLNLANSSQPRLASGPALSAFEHLVALLEDEAGAGVYDFRSATNSGIFEATNLAGTLASFQQNSSANQPAILPTTGLWFDGNDDRITVNATGICSIDLLLRKAAGSVNGHIIGTLRLYTEDSPNGSSRTTIDGIATPTRGAVFTALDDAAWHHIRFTGLSFSGVLALGHSVNSMAGDIMLCAIIPEEQFTTAQLENVRAASSAWIASQRP